MGASLLALAKSIYYEISHVRSIYASGRVHEPHFQNIDFELTSDAKIQPALTFTYRESLLTFLTVTR